nr:MAG TPA: hypothetical protein [Caudoviricetes sp.]
MSSGSTSDGLQNHVHRQLRIARPMPGGRLLETAGDRRPR